MLTLERLLELLQMFVRLTGERPTQITLSPANYTEIIGNKEAWRVRLLQVESFRIEARMNKQMPDDEVSVANMKSDRHLRMALPRSKTIFEHLLDEDEIC